MALIEGWRDAGPAERASMARSYLDVFFGPRRTRTSPACPASLLLADALGNARSAAAARGHDPEALTVTVDEVKAELMRIAYETRHELVAPYIPRQLAWGQHGQHFVRSRNNKKKKDRSG